MKKNPCQCNKLKQTNTAPHKVLLTRSRSRLQSARVLSPAAEPRGEGADRAHRVVRRVQVQRQPGEVLPLPRGVPAGTRCLYLRHAGCVDLLAVDLGTVGICPLTLRNLLLMAQSQTRNAHHHTSLRALSKATPSPRAVRRLRIQVLPYLAAEGSGKFGTRFDFEKHEQRQQLE